MKKTSSISTAILAIASFLLMVSCSGRDESMSSPNILFIMSDDHAYQAISAYSRHLISTPGIDRLASEGMIFTRAAVTNSLCAPSRAVIFTGKHSHLNGKIDNAFPFDTSQLTFPQLLREAGYQTAIFGKLHFGNKPRGFDRFSILPGQGNYYNPEFITNDRGRIVVEGYVSDIITDMSIEWLENERSPDSPFFLASWHKAPHREWLPPARYFREYTGKTFPEPATLFDNFDNRGTAAREAEMNLLEHMNWAGDSKIEPGILDKLGIPDRSGWDHAAFRREVGRQDSLQRESWDSVYGPVNDEFAMLWPMMDDSAKMRWRYQRYMQDYLGSVAAVDDNVARLLDYLDRSGLAENTIVIYTSDQGFYLGEHGWFDKRFIYEESFRTPLLVRWPGVIEAGSSCDILVQNLDFAQTILDAAGVEAPLDMQGESLVPLMRGDTAGWERDALYYHYYEYPGIHMVKRHYGIVTDRYKLVHFYYDIDEWELYDRETDTMELNNVIDRPEYSEVAAELKNRLAELRRYYGDSEQLDSLYLSGVRRK